MLTSNKQCGKTIYHLLCRITSSKVDLLTSYSSVSKNGSRFFSFSCFVSSFGFGFGASLAAAAATVLRFGAGLALGGVGTGFGGGGLAFGGGDFGFGFFGTQPARVMETVRRNASSSSSKSA